MNSQIIFHNKITTHGNAARRHQSAVGRSGPANRVSEKSEKCPGAGQGGGGGCREVVIGLSRGAVRDRSRYTGATCPRGRASFTRRAAPISLAQLSMHPSPLALVTQPGTLRSGEPMSLTRAHTEIYSSYLKFKKLFKHNCRVNRSVGGALDKCISTEINIQLFNIVKALPLYRVKNLKNQTVGIEF